MYALSYSRLAATLRRLTFAQPTGSHVLITSSQKVTRPKTRHQYCFPSCMNMKNFRKRYKQRPSPFNYDQPNSEVVGLWNLPENNSIYEPTRWCAHPEICWLSNMARLPRLYWAVVFCHGLLLRAFNLLCIVAPYPYMHCTHFMHMVHGFSRIVEVPLREDLIHLESVGSRRITRHAFNWQLC